MATKRWKGQAQDTAQVNTITPANVGVGNTFTVTINSKSYTFTATAGTVANVTAGLAALLQASVEGEFTEITWADATTAITATAKTKGKPFTQTSSASGGTATNVTAVTTANVSRNDINNATNWSPSGVPGAADDVYIDNSSISLLYNLDALAAVTFTSLTIDQSFTGDVGLSETNSDGTEYLEYRPQYFQCGATTITIGRGEGSGSGMVKIDNVALATTMNVIDSGSPKEDGREAILWKGTHASNVINITGGSLGVAIFGGEVATVATLRMGSGLLGAAEPSVRCGAGVTLTTITKEAGTLEIGSSLTTLNNHGGDVTINAGTITTLTVNAGTCSYLGTGTITTVNIAGGATMDLSGVPVGRTFTNTNMHAGARLHDPASTVTFSTAIVPTRCDISDLILTLGKNRGFTPA